RLHRRTRKLLAQIPTPQQLNIARDILRDHDAAGGIDLEFLEMLEEQGSKSLGDFVEQGRQVCAGGDSGEEEGVEAGEKSVDTLASWCLEKFHICARCCCVVARAEIKFLLVGEEFGGPVEDDVDGVLHCGINFIFKSVHCLGGGSSHFFADGDVGGGEGDEDGVDEGGEEMHYFQPPEGASPSAPARDLTSRVSQQSSAIRLRAFSKVRMSGFGSKTLAWVAGADRRFAGTALSERVSTKSLTMKSRRAPSSLFIQHGHDSLGIQCLGLALIRLRLLHPAIHRAFDIIQAGFTVTMVASRETQIYRKDANNLSTKEREKLLKPYLPTRPSKTTKRSRKSQPIRMFLRTQIHVFVFTVMHLFFSLYIRLRQAFHVTLDRVFAMLYYHHRAPELIKQDVQALDKLPQHLSVILDLKEEQGFAGLEKLLDDVSEVSAWCAAAGIPMLSVYEKTGELAMLGKGMVDGDVNDQKGILKDHIQRTHRVVSSKLHSYFGRRVPSLQIQAPHVPSFLDGEDQEPTPSSAGHLSVLLLSADDGRATLVDLTKTLTEMSQRNKLSADDISADLIDAEISESVMPEPDLLILFAPYVQLQGYPPWQIRLTEIYHSQDNSGVGYQVFLRALSATSSGHVTLPKYENLVPDYDRSLRRKPSGSSIIKATSTNMDSTVLILNISRQADLASAQSTGLPSKKPVATSDADPASGTAATATTTSSDSNSGLTTSLPTTSRALPTSPSSSLDLPPTSTDSSTSAEVGGDPSLGSTHPAHWTAIIVGIVIGVIAALLAGWLIWRCVRRKKAVKMNRAGNLARERDLPEGQAQRPGQGLGLYQDGYYSAAEIPSGMASEAQAAVSKRSRNGQQEKFPFSPSSFRHSSTHEESVPSALSSPNNGGLFPTSPGLLSELSGESSPTHELSPNPERLQINSSRHQSSLSVQDQNSDTHLPNESANARMRPNLETSRDYQGNGRGSHVLSWMSYGDGTAGPAR
ncbi:MAG: hypothetical protein Q9218_006669, partial [Villophora microphyllina]